MELGKFENIEWFFSSGKEIVGPFSRTRVQEKIRPLIESNQKVFVWKYGNLRWVPAQEVFFIEETVLPKVSEKLNQTVASRASFSQENNFRVSDEEIVFPVASAFERLANLAAVVLFLCVLTLLSLKMVAIFK